MSGTDDDRTDDTRSSRTEPSDAVEAKGDSGSADSREPEVSGGGGRVPEPVEPGSPSLENAAFVALGVASMIALVVHLLSLL